MQQPIVVFDHITHTVTTISTAPKPDRRVDELLAAQQQQVTSSGRPQ
jgi:hypothetical protein